MTQDTVSLNAEQLAKHAMYQAYESHNELHCGSIPEEVNDVSLYDAHKNITEVDEITTETRHGPSFSDDLAEGEVLDGLAVEAKMTGYVSEQTSRGSHTHPPEYKNHDADVFVMAWWFPRPDELAPLTAIDVATEGGMPTPPDPEPYDDRL